jgi:hypothetical protein
LRGPDPESGAGLKVVLVILDGYAAAIEGDENTVASVREIFQNFLLPVLASNMVAMLITHHPRWASIL